MTKRSKAEIALMTDHDWHVKIATGRWPKQPLRPRPAQKRLTRRSAPVEREPLPRHKRGEERLTVAEVRRRLSAIKLERGCVDCGYNAHPAALEFDHVTGRKSAALSQISTPFWSVMASEMAKCEVVCANCHRVRHAKRIRKLE